MQSNPSNLCNLSHSFRRQISEPMNIIERFKVWSITFSLPILWVVPIPGAAQNPPFEERSAQHPAPVHSQSRTVYSPDKKFFILIMPEARLKYCRTEDGEPIRTLYHCRSKSAVFSPDGTLLASIGTSQNGSSTIKVWQVTDGSLIGRFASESEEFRSLVFSPDGQLLAGVSGKTRIHLWEIPASQLRWSTPLRRSISSLAFSADGRTVIAHCADRSKKAFAALNGQSTRR